MLIVCFFCSRPVRFGLALPCAENKENARPHVINEDCDSDSNDGPVLYRDDNADEHSKSTDHIRGVLKKYCEFRI